MPAGTVLQRRRQGHGGEGGDGSSGSGGPTNGNVNAPIGLGSGGGGTGVGDGGGAIWIEADGRIEIDGTLTANGRDGNHGGGGAGGSIFLAGGSFMGGPLASIEARGGTGGLRIECELADRAGELGGLVVMIPDSSET